MFKYLLFFFLVVSSIQSKVILLDAQESADAQKTDVVNTSLLGEIDTKTSSNLVKANVNLHEIEIPKLMLNAQATIRKPPDELQLKIGVVTLGDTAEAALEENSLRMQAIVKSLGILGLLRSDYETGHFAIHPTYTPYPKDAPADWKPGINGYEVTNSIIIHTNKLDLAGKLIDEANKAGANTIEDIRFGLHDPRIFWNEVVAIATANAIDDAKTISLAAGIKLVRILSISLGNPSIIAPNTNTAYLSKMVSADLNPPIEPGDVSITATLSVTYEISSS